MIKLITEAYIKTNSPVTWNVQMKDIANHIVGAQSMYLRVILGEGYMTYLQGKYDDQTLTNDELDLMEKYIQPALLWRTLYLAAPFSFSEWRAKGFVKNYDDNGTSSDFTEFKYVRAEIRDRAEVLEEELRKYLCKEGKKFPEFINQPGCPCGGTNFYSGLLFY